MIFLEDFLILFKKEDIDTDKSFDMMPQRNLVSAIAMKANFRSILKPM